MVYVLPRDYNFVTKVSEPADCEKDEMERHKPVYYFEMNNGYIE